MVGLMDREAQSICMSISDIDIDPSLFFLVGTEHWNTLLKSLGVFALGSSYAVHVRDRLCQNTNGLPKLDGGREVAPSDAHHPFGPRDSDGGSAGIVEIKMRFLRQGTEV